ncbi:MAG: hypothetical protein KKI08_15240 [Armatimonadetes bacterium]|nr:hypothetical protein [Armatimonadota bacterium]
MHVTRSLLVATLLLGVRSVCVAQAPADFTPAPFTAPGPNIALHKSYTLDPAPNYGDCSLDPQHVLLTDGVYTKGYFWVQKTTVGWVHRRPVIITLDLGEVQPIAGLSYNTAAGVADVAWPSSILTMVSDDGKEWTVAGDLIALSNQRGAPPATPYRLHKFVTDGLQTRGRYVALLVDQVPYTVVDEVEVYRGQDAWLNVAPPGKRVSLSPKEYQRTQQVLLAGQARLQSDLAEIVRGLDSARLSDAQKADLRARAEKLGGEIDAWEDVPADFTTVLPLNELHTRIVALNAPLLRARGYKRLTAWGAYRYDMLQPLEAPGKPPTAPPALSVRMMRGEHRAEVLNLTNPGDAPLTVTVKASNLGRYASALTLREVIFTDTRERMPVASAILPGQPGEQGLPVNIPAGTTRQVWLDFDSTGVPTGEVRGTLQVSSADGTDTLKLPLSLHVAGPVMPSEFSTAIGGWDETNNKGGYMVTAENMLPLIANLRAHGVNMPWSNPQVMPTPGEYDAAGNMTAPPDFTAWDEWVERWQGAPYWGLFPNVRDNFAKEPMGTERFNKMVGAWATAWVQHAAAQGIKPGQIMILLVDEPSRDAQDQTIITWAKALHAAQPDIVIWNDPVHPDPAKVAPEFYTEADVLCPNATIFLRSDQAYRDFYVRTLASSAQKQAGRELWFYSCSGPSKLLDPASYYRGQFWLNLQYGGKGSCYWAFGDDGGNSWNAYVQPRACFSPLFLSKTDVTDAKQMEAIREGAQDVEYFVMLRARAAELERKGATGKLLAEAKALLADGPAQATAIMGGDKQRWATPKDRTIMDRLRLQALDLLEKLARL